MVALYGSAYTAFVTRPSCSNTFSCELEYGVLGEDLLVIASFYLIAGVLGIIAGVMAKTGKPRISVAVFLIAMAMGLARGLGFAWRWDDLQLYALVPSIIFLAGALLSVIGRQAIRQEWNLANSHQAQLPG